jgi:5-(carboxyamino)imidazole ribonucleotide mutase
MLLRFAEIHVTRVRKRVMLAMDGEASARARPRKSRDPFAASAGRIYIPGFTPGKEESVEGSPRVGIIMGSRSDRETMNEAARVLDELEVPYEMEIVSAHRTPDRMFRYAETAEQRGLEVIIAGAGGAAHLPGMTASKTTLPVIGVPVLSSALNGLDSLLSIVQMPRGVPVATVAIGKAGAANAGLLAARILGSHDERIRDRLRSYAGRMAEDALREEPAMPAAG